MIKKDNNELLFVTGNSNKINEASMYLNDYKINKAGVHVPEIQSTDVIEVVKAKLESAFAQTEKPCFVMDASLVINGMCKQDDSEKQFPGALIKDVFGSMGDKNITEIVKITNDTRCLWKSILGYNDGENEYYFEESVKGNIASSPKGENGYDWDTIFIPEGEIKTFAEMEPNEKQRYALTKDLYKQFNNFLKNR